MTKRETANPIAIPQATNNPPVINARPLNDMATAVRKMLVDAVMSARCLLDMSGLAAKTDLKPFQLKPIATHNRGGMKEITLYLAGSPLSEAINVPVA